MIFLGLVKLRTCPDKTEEPGSIGDDDMANTRRIFADHAVHHDLGHLRVEVGILGVLTVHQHGESHSLRLFIVLQSAERCVRDF